MVVMTREKVLEMVRQDCAGKGWQDVVDALEDGEYLKNLGITDDHINVVEAAHARACEMAEIHPDYKF